MTEYEASKILDDYIKLPEMFQYYGYEINRAGFCRCPFHMEDTPSCKVNDYQFHCFGCDARGNSLSFVKALFKLPFKEAMQKINDDFRLGLLNEGMKLTPEQKQNIKKRQIDIYEKKQADLEIEELKQEYLQAWKDYILYKPEDKDYDINTPSYLVDEWWNDIDPRYWAAVSKLNELKDYAYVGNFKIDEEEARWTFTK